MDKKIFIINGSGCVDCDTEYFNGYKWEKISHYKEGDKVLQYNSDGTAELTIPLAYIKQKQDKLNLFQNTYLDMCVSDDHVCYYMTSKNNLYHKTFKEIKQNFNESIGGFNGRFITSFNYITPHQINLTDGEIKLMIAIIADGHFRSNTSNTCYLNLKKERKKIEFRKICQDNNIPYTEKTYPSMPGYSRFFVKAPRHEKYFSSYWYNCSKEQLKLILENVLKWDGDNKNSFFTTNKESADFIQFVFSALGYHASIGSINRIGQKHYKSIEYSVHKSKTNLHQMNKDNRNKTSSSIIKEYVPLDGYEYCFSVPSGMWVMRRNNKICITGNCTGKDTFVNLFAECYGADKVWNYSSVDKVKRIAKEIGWTGEKTERDRKFLSDLKLLTTDYNDMPFNDIMNKIQEFKNSNAEVLFLHIREPEEISKVIYRIHASTILVKRDSVNQITSNMADANVYNYIYDITIHNNGTIEDLKNIVQKFIKDVKLGVWFHHAIYD